jgi:hypothetical protein
VAEGSLELPSDEYVRRDLMGIRKLARQGGVTIELPRTPDGRHGDYAPAIVLALHGWVAEPTADPKPAPKYLTQEWHDAAMRKEMRRIDAHLRARNEGSYGVIIDELPEWLEGIDA